MGRVGGIPGEMEELGCYWIGYETRGEELHGINGISKQFSK
jgi:hypothetical protein